jgi:DNA adenine methylase
MHFSYYFSKALIENSTIKLSEKDVQMLLQKNENANTFISDTFRGLYFSDEENNFLDSLRANIELLDNQYKKSMALAAITRACMKRRARGIFTYVGERYDDGRKDLRISLIQHFIDNVKDFNNAVFENGYDNLSTNYDVFDLNIDADLVYLDPPYWTPNSDNDYSRRYHFVEGLVRNWDGLEILDKTKTKKFKRYETPFLHKEFIYETFERLVEKFKKSIIVLSYSSNSVPDKSDLVEMLKRRKKHVQVIQIGHQYSFGNQGDKLGNISNKVNEYIFLAY